MNKRAAIVLVCIVAALLLVLIFVMAAAMDNPGEQPIPGTNQPKTTDGSDATTQDTTPSQGQFVEDWDDNIDSTTDGTEPSETTDASDPKQPDNPGPSDTIRPDNPTQPTEPSKRPTEPSTRPTEPSTQPTKPSTQPTEPSATPEKPLDAYTYEDYLAMSGVERQEFVERFDSIDDFWDWYDAAKEEYDSQRETIVVGGDGGGIDIGDIIGGNG